MLVVRARRQICGVPLGQVEETMRPLPIVSFPGAPSFVLGAARIRGLPVPLVDLGALLEQHEAPAPRRWVTLRLHDRRVALVVEEVLGIRALEGETLADLPPLLEGARSPGVEALGTLDHDLLVALHGGRLLPETLLASLPSDVQS